jgi:hypothetical protein
VTKTNKPPNSKLCQINLKTLKLQMLKPSDTPNPLLQSFDVIEKRKEKGQRDKAT